MATWWEGAYIRETTARQLMSAPWSLDELDLRWRIMYATNQVRLDADGRSVFVQPSDYHYVLRYDLHWDNGNVRLFRNNAGKSNMYLLCIRRGCEIIYATKVLMLSKPKFQQGTMKFDVTGMNGDQIGQYTFRMGEKVTVKQIITMVRADLGDGVRNVQAIYICIYECDHIPNQTPDLHMYFIIYTHFLKYTIYRFTYMHVTSPRGAGCYVQSRLCSETSWKRGGISTTTAASTAQSLRQTAVVHSNRA